MLLEKLKTRFRNNARRLDRLTTEAPARSVRTCPPLAAWLPRYLPHYFSSAPADFHEELTGQLDTLHNHRGTKSAIIAPREGAKSTIITLAYVLRAAVEQLEPFTLILSDSAGQAVEKLVDLRRELEGNERLAADYSEACGIGPVWRNDRIELRNGAVIQAIGRKGRIRGRRNRQDRPSLIIFDDVENNTTITSVAERTATWRWATREVIPSGSAGTNFLSVGSALHRECVAVRLGGLAGWSNRTHRALHSWPEQMELWGEWERIATNLADDKRSETARTYYETNRDAMDEGAVVYWPERWPLYALMQRRAEIGAAAFDTEYQGTPSVEGMTEWPAEYFDRPELWFDQWPEELAFRVQSLDPSKGSCTKPSDYQAHVQVGLSRDGTIYVEARLERETVDRMVKRALDMATTFGRLDSLSIESNDGLGLLLEEFSQQLTAANRVVPLQGFMQTQNKIVRIRRLGLYFSRSRVRFRKAAGTRLLVDQLRDFPSAEYDDGPDALELAFRCLELITQPEARN